MGMTLVEPRRPPLERGTTLVEDARGSWSRVVPLTGAPSPSAARGDEPLGNPQRLTRSRLPPTLYASCFMTRVCRCEAGTVWLRGGEQGLMGLRGRGSSASTVVDQTIRGGEPEQAHHTYLTGKSTTVVPTPPRPSDHRDHPVCQHTGAPAPKDPAQLASADEKD